MSTITKPVVLDETGQAIAQAIQAIANQDRNIWNAASQAAASAQTAQQQVAQAQAQAQAAAASAAEAADTLEDLEAAIQQLPDGQAVSEQVAQNTLDIAKKIDKTEVEEDYAKKNGYYSPMTVGAAENLVGRGSVTAEYTRRTSGGDKDLGTGSATILRHRGKTLVWNQLLPKHSAAAEVNVNGIIYSWDADGVLTIEGENTSDSQVIITYGGVDIIKGHKYYLGYGVEPSYGRVEIGCNVSPNLPSIWNVASGISTAGNTASDNMGIYIKGGAIIPRTKLYPTMTDLTLMFGRGYEPATAEEFEAMFPKRKYAKDEGTLVSNAAQYIKTIGFNQWDEQWQNGYYNASGVRVTQAGEICTKNFIPVFPNTVYYFGTAQAYNQTRGNICYYDENKSFIRRDDSTALFTTPSNARFIQMSFGQLYGGTYKNDICINLSWSGYRNGEYEAYKENIVPLKLNSFKVKSHNIWDEELETGVYNQSDGRPGAGDDRKRSKNRIPVIGGERYYAVSPSAQLLVLQYDANDNYLGDTSVRTINRSGGSFSTFTACRYIRFYTGEALSTYNNDICINLSSSFDGNYEPYGDNGVITITGGLRSGGLPYDEISGGKYIKRAGERVFTGSEAWEKNQYRLQLNLGHIGAKQNNLTCYLVSSLYIVGPQNEQYMGTANKTLSFFDVSGSTYIGIQDDSYSDIPSFKTYLQGLYSSGKPLTVYYELASPIEYELVDEIPMNYPVDDFGTEERLPEDTASAVLAPICYDVRYAMNAVDTLRRMPENYISKDSLTHLLAALQGAGIIGGYTMTYDSVNEAYNFTITAPSPTPNE